MQQLKELIVADRHLSGHFLEDQVARCASGLIALDCMAGDRIAILLRNSLEQLTATLAAQHIGAYPVQLNWHGQETELRYVLQDCGARVLVIHTDLWPHLGSAPLTGVHVIAITPDEGLKSAYRIDTADTTVPSGALAWEPWLASQMPTSSGPAVPKDSIIYTSGTTGHPKGVRRFPATAQQMVWTERMRQQVTGIDTHARAMVPAPLYHSAPLMFAMRAVRKAQALHLPPRFEASAFLRDVEKYRITHVYVVPTMFVRLLALPAELRMRHDLSSLQVVLHAGGPCAPSVKRAMIDWWGPVIHEYYGSTEAGPCTFCDSHDALSRPGTVGRAIDNVVIQVQDELGRRVPDGEVGEICVRNDAYADFTYLHRDKDRTALQRGNVQASGDLGFRDQDGYYYICDRKRDMVISGAVNIYPVEIEAVILELPEVADCAVFGIPDPEFGEVLAAFVERRPNGALDANQITTHLKQRLASFKVPRIVEFRENLARDESGKIRRRKTSSPMK